MLKKFKAVLLARCLQERIPGAGESPDYNRGYDAAMMEMARLINSYEPEQKAK